VAKKVPWILHVYVPVEKQRLVERAKEVARREGSSLSKLILAYLEEYVRRHEGGNPQTRLDRILSGSEPAAKTCAMCRNPAAILGYRGGVQVRLCRDHFHRLRHTLKGYRVLNG